MIMAKPTVTQVLVFGVGGITLLIGIIMLVLGENALAPLLNAACWAGWGRIQYLSDRNEQLLAEIENTIEAICRFNSMKSLTRTN